MAVLRKIKICLCSRKFFPIIPARSCEFLKKIKIINHKYLNYIDRIAIKDRTLFWTCGRSCPRHLSTPTLKPSNRSNKKWKERLPFVGEGSISVTGDIDIKYGRDVVWIFAQDETEFAALSHRHKKNVLPNQKCEIQVSRQKSFPLLKWIAAILILSTYFELFVVWCAYRQDYANHLPMDASTFEQKQNRLIFFYIFPEKSTVIIKPDRLSRLLFFCRIKLCRTRW